MFRKKHSKTSPKVKVGEMWGDPIYFAVHKVAAIDVTKFDLPKTYGHLIYLISFSSRHLECPTSEPIAVYHYAGIRRFMWMDRFWTEVNIDWRDIHAKIVRMSRQYAGLSEDLIELLQLYSITNSPISNSDDAM